MFFTIGWSVFVHFVQLYTKRVSCAVPIRIVTMKATGELTPSQPAVIHIIPDQDPLIQGRRQQTTQSPFTQANPYERQQTPHPVPALRNSYEESYESSETEEFPNANNYTGYYYDKDYYKFYSSYYEDNGDVGFQFKDNRYPYGHTLFAEALAAKQIPFVFKEVFLPTQAKVRLSSILVNDFYTQTVPFELFPAINQRRHRRILNNKIPKKTTILKPQTQHPIRRKNHPKESPNSKYYKSALSYYAYNEEQRDDSKHNSAKTNGDKSSNNKNFKSMLSYNEANSYKEDENDRKKQSSYKKERHLKKRTQPSKFRRLLEMIRSTPSELDMAQQELGPESQIATYPPNYQVSIFADPQNGAPIFLPEDGNLLFMSTTTALPFNGRRSFMSTPDDSHEGRIFEPDSPLDMNMVGAAEMAIAPAVSFFKNLLRG